MKLKLILFSWLFSSLAIAQIPDGYYDGTDGLSGDALKSKLNEIITNNHNQISYNQVWTVLKESDLDPDNSDNVLLIYGSTDSDTGTHARYRSKDMNGGNSGDWNREHVYAKSLGSPNLGTSGPGADAHHLRPADVSLNSNRGSLKFADGSGATAGSSNGGWYPGDEWKGDVARMVMYMYVRYGDRCALTNVAEGLATTNAEIPDVLLKWNTEDPVSDFEIQRNNVVYTYQENRNPFIDHPEFVSAIWGTFGEDDDENPTAITDLVAANPTSSSIDLSWTAATDNVGVTSYEVYMDGALQTSVSGTSTTISGLSANTTYTFYIIAKDAAGNSSEQSNTATETTLDGSTDGGTGECSQTEDFENIPTDSSSSYNSRTWTNNGITWTATRARTDQSINSKTIVTKSSATVTSSTISDGISSLTLTTQRFFSGGEGNLIIKINGTEVGTIPYTDEVQTTTISDINVSGDFIMLIENSDGDRVGIDDLTWNCYSSMSTQDLDEENDFRLYPNPVSHGSLYVSGSHLEEVKSVSIFNMNGQLVKKIINPFIQGNQIDVSGFAKGVYVIKFDQQVKKFMVK